MSSDLQDQAVREIAYFKWEQAGCPIGDGINFWLEAEREFSDQQPCEPTDDVRLLPKSKIEKTICEPSPILVAKVKSNSRKRAS